MTKLCLYFNHPAQYREEIYLKIDKEFDCDWYFEKSDTDITKFDINILSRSYWFNISKIGGFYWTKGLLALLKKGYDNYLMIGATRCLSLYVFLLIKKIFYPQKRVFLWTHGFYGKESWIEKNLFKRPLFKLADSILVYGDFSRDLMISGGFDPNKVVTIHNSLAYSKQLKLRNSLLYSDIYKKHFSNNFPVLIFIGRLTSVKKLDMIIDALLILKNRNEFYNLVLVGDGSDRLFLESKVMDMGLRDMVWFYGACFDERQNAELIYNADLCVSPGNIGLTVIHSLMFGCPAITHNDFKWQMPEFEAIQTGATGDFFERGNVHDLSDTISRWFLEYQSHRDSVRNACYEKVDSQWNPEFQLNVLKNILH